MSTTSNWLNGASSDKYYQSDAVIFDATGSYSAAFLNGVGWNLLNVTIVLFLLFRARQRSRLAMA